MREQRGRGYSVGKTGNNPALGWNKAFSHPLTSHKWFPRFFFSAQLPSTFQHSVYVPTNQILLEVTGAQEKINPDMGKYWRIFSRIGRMNSPPPPPRFCIRSLNFPHIWGKFYSFYLAVCRDPFFLWWQGGRTFAWASTSIVSWPKRQMLSRIAGLLCGKEWGNRDKHSWPGVTHTLGWRYEY